MSYRFEVLLGLISLPIVAGEYSSVGTGRPDEGSTDRKEVC